MQKIPSAAKESLKLFFKTSLWDSPKKFAFWSPRNKIPIQWRLLSSEVYTQKRASSIEDENILLHSSTDSKKLTIVFLKHFWPLPFNFPFSMLLNNFNWCSIIFEKTKILKDFDWTIIVILIA